MQPSMKVLLALLGAGVLAFGEELQVIVVKAPTQLVIEQYKTRVDVATGDFQPVRIEARPNLTQGSLLEMNIRVGSDLRSDGMSLKSGINDVKPFAAVMTRGLNRVPQMGEAFTYEYTITFFETDEPPGHIWSPKRGKAYKVLWTKTLKGQVK